MMFSRILAVVIVVVAAGWIASGSLGANPKTDETRVEQPEKPRFRVAVMPVSTEAHANRIILSGRTEADRRANAFARANGTVVELNVQRGSIVKTGDVIAELSDEARLAQVTQARARLEQRKQELDVRLKLIQQGNMAAINRPQLEADYRSAEAALAQAEAERDRGTVLAPISGVINDVPVQLGQALQVGQSVAEVISLQPMLAVVEVAERQIGGVKVGEKATVKLVTGKQAEGQIRFVSRRASPQTRTYRVEVAIPNEDGTIPDGITAEITLLLAPQEAAQIPRSALTFSSEGRLGVRIAGSDDKVSFVPVAIMEDGIDQLWVSGVRNGARVIVQGQDFIKEGQLVQPVQANSPNPA